MSRAQAVRETVAEILSRSVGRMVDGGVLVDAETMRLTAQCADAIDASLPCWLRVDRDAPVDADWRVGLLVDEEAAALDPIGREVLAGIREAERKGAR